ncbi:MAG TPA: hypothetical protein VN461_19485 [Vicinamibacteria bacterium]|jgi:hypothetical protein|nr:hypothetical protein [Vicinamibacteria bacterium]
MLKMSATAVTLALSALLLHAGPARRDVPEFPTLDPKHWVGTPVSIRELRGRVVLLDVWTFG